MTTASSRENVVFACDIGSIRKGNFWWASSDARYPGSGDPATLVDAMVRELTTGRRVSLGLECPLYLPCDEDPFDLGRARRVDCHPAFGNRPFGASAGACSSITGTPIACWIFRRLHKSLPALRATTRLAEWDRVTHPLLIWEAFVSGKLKGPQGTHAGDAKLAVQAFGAGSFASEPNTDPTSCRPLFSLAGAALLWAELSDDVTLLREACLVARPVVDPLVDPPRRLSKCDDPLLFQRTSAGIELLWLRPHPKENSFERGMPYALTIDGYKLCDSLGWEPSARDVEACEQLKFVKLRALLFFLQRSIRYAEGSRRDAEGRSMFKRCHAAIVQAWEREAVSHLNDARQATVLIDQLL